MVCVAGLILAAGAWGPVTAAEMEKEEQLAAEPIETPEMPARGPHFELGPEQVEKILAQIREKDPQKADALMKLHEENPEAFMAEIRNVAREQFMARRAEQGKQQPRRRLGGPMQEGPGQGEGPQMMRERMQERSEEYMKWLKGTYPDEATKLEQLKEGNPEQYMRALGISGRKYGPIFQASKDNPQLVAVLKDQLALRENRTELLKQIKATTDDKQKKAIVKELEGVVSQQFDLIVKRKQLAYEDLTKKLEQLQKEVDQRKAEVEKWKGKDFKNEQVKQRINELVSETEKFEWE
jgi:hypothetical protein